ncbi:hypothetical protein BVIET440_40224 [Burkholderia vietnamiensis]
MPHRMSASACALRLHVGSGPPVTATLMPVSSVKTFATFANAVSGPPAPYRRTTPSRASRRIVGSAVSWADAPHANSSNANDMAMFFFNAFSTMDSFRGVVRAVVGFDALRIALQRQNRSHGLHLVHEFRNRRIDARARQRVDLEIRDDAIAAFAADRRHPEHQAARNAILAAGHDAHRHPAPAAAANPVAHLVDRRIGGRRRRRGAARFDDRRAAARDFGDERVEIPALVADTHRRGLLVDQRVTVVGEHGRRMIAPHRHAADGIDRYAASGGQLRHGAIVVETDHRGNRIRRQVGRVVAGHPRVGIGRVADDEHLHLPVRHFVERLALGAEDGGVRGQQIAPFHPFATRARSDEHRVIGIAERDARIVADFDRLQQREGAVFQFHHHAAQRVQRVRQFQELKDDGLIVAEQIAAGDSKQQ